ncbi:ankyrin repeat domain-containing protein [Flavobacterium sp.]|jgi:ankyrin repeat protein|uniref:ankyrin repeat domain-containing protein n=1 Tax=Flavobacterium sp. TaxID=239 RepID=UPI0037BE826E
MKQIILAWFFLVQLNIGFSQESIFTIARSGNVEQVKELMKAQPNCINQKNADGYTPLILACYRSNNEVAVFFIQNGALINENSPMGTALMAAVVKGNVEITKLLISKNADVNSADANGTTALIYAVQFKNKAILSLLIKSNADKTHKDNDGKTAFEHAVFAGDEDIINLLK